MDCYCRVLDNAISSATLLILQMLDSKNCDWLEYHWTLHDTVVLIRISTNDHAIFLRSFLQPTARTKISMVGHPSWHLIYLQLTVAILAKYLRPTAVSKNLTAHGSV